MNTKTLSPRALSVIDQYLHFRIGSAACSIPYFNNKTVRARAALRVNGGKGSPQDILDETHALLVRAHIKPDALADQSLKKILADNGIGIDCSGFAYYVLNAESQEAGRGGLDRHISFADGRGLLARMRSKMRPVENAGVALLAHEKNSAPVLLSDVRPGDFISMLGTPESAAANGGSRDHILIIHQVEYQNGAPYKLHYSHAIAYPEDGLYGSGVRQGTIEILDPSAGILDARWTEDGRSNLDARIYLRAKSSKTELRRLRWIA